MNGIRVLVVEDEQITARDLQATLQSLGYEVPTIVETAEDALLGVERMRPNLVLMDIRIRSKRDGISAADEIRRRFGIPVVYLTAYADPDTVERATRTEAYGYLLKPFSEQELHTTIQVALYKAEAERAIRASEERFRKLVENASDMVTVVDASGTVVYKGPSVRRVLGYEPEDLVGRKVAEVIHPDDQDSILEALRRCLDHPGECIPVEYRMLHGHGGWRFMEARGTNRIHDAAVGGIVINSRDITERKEAEAVIRAAQEAAERASRVKTELLSRASHELRTPLNAILGFGQLLEVDPTLQDLESVEQILAAGRHLLAVVDEVLDLAAIEAGRVVLSAEPVLVSLVVRQSMDLITPLAAQRHISLQANEAFRVPHRAIADPQRLKQVLINLLSNAVKYNREGGCVTVLCQDGPREGRLRIGVRDTGPGIPREQVERLFVPFERLEAERHGVKGTGLGLVLSRGLAEAMGGQLTVESVEGVGSTFWVELPQTRPSPGELPNLGAPGVQESSASGERAMTVLYVEDNLANIRLVERIVGKKPQVRLRVALTGTDGIRMAQEHTPDLLLLDLLLPDLDGEEVLRQLRREPATSQVPVVALSSNAYPEQIGRFLSLGVSSYLTKPFQVSQLLALLDERLQEIEWLRTKGRQEAE